MAFPLRRAASAVVALALGLATAACGKPTTSQSAPPQGAQGASGQPAKQMTVLIRMIDAQDKYFRENILAKFEKEKGVKLNVVVFDKEEDVLAMVKLEQDSGNKTIGLIKTAESVVPAMVAKKYVLPLKDIVGEEQLKKDLADYEKVALDFGTFDGVTYYIPRKLETNVMLYLKSKVQEAVANWKKFEPQIQAALKQYNGYGLPKDYTLEADPNQWDWYDLLVAGYYWANTEYGGVKAGRIAHRTRKYEGTTTELFTKVLQAGGKPEDMLKGDTQPWVDAFLWEAVQQELGIYNKRMLTENWTGGSIWKAMSEGQVFLAFMHQIDAFFVHGGTHPSMQGYLQNPDDMGLAVMPAGVSLELNPDGTPKRRGAHVSNLSGWWWGIPVTSPDPKLSYELARWITNYENHLAEAKTFGMMPVRKDVLGKVDQTFDQPWMREVFQVANRQLQQGAFFKPVHPAWPQISAEILEMYHNVVIGRKYLNNGRVDAEAMRAAMKPHADKIKALASTK